MKVFDTELERLDLLDPDMVEKIEDARDKVLECVKTASESQKQSESIRIQCDAVAGFINELWGEGTAQKIFKGKTNLLTYMKALGEILDGIEADTNAQYSELERITSKYSPVRILK